jgi:DNA-binding transcriptional MocR family regulator
MLDLAQYQINGSTAQEIAVSTEAAIREGRLDVGEHLPTVRALAGALRTSPATVNSAYRTLRQRGLIVTDGRRGTRVAPRPPLRAPEQHPDVDFAHQPSSGLRDLAVGLPDPALLPDLGRALARVDVEQKLTISGLESSDPELLELAGAAFAADGVPVVRTAVLAGAFDALERILGAHLRPGDRVIVEDPAYTAIRDLLLALALVPVPVAVDESGLVPNRFADALERGAEAAIVVPRAQNPFGAAMDAERVRELRAVLEPHPDLLLVEDDHAGAVAGAACTTLVTPERRRWAVIRSVSKVLHPDLRLALLAADPTTVARIEGRQALGPRWVSHILQATVVELLKDPDFEAVTERARNVYAARRQALIDALAGHGLAAHGRSGLNVWVPVREEAPVIRALYEAGWIVLAGERFRIHTAPGIRVTIATLHEDEAPALASVIARVEQARNPRELY